MKSLERGMEQNLMLNKDKSMEVQIALSGVKKLCEKKGEKGKCWRSTDVNSDEPTCARNCST